MASSPAVEAKAQAKPIKQEDEWIEIPAYYPDGGLSGEEVSGRKLELRPGTSDERIRLSISGSDNEVDIDSLESAIAMVRGYEA